ncbi:hypothetical protein AB4Z50_14455 [Paenibacillus sp. 2TAB26]
MLLITKKVVIRVVEFSKVMKFFEENKEEYYKELLEKEAEELAKARKEAAEKKRKLKDGLCRPSSFIHSGL